MYFTGEIYNYSEFNIDGRGGHFLHEVYRSFGLDGLARVRGSYACVFEDKNKTILIRDQFGSIPLYYYTKKMGDGFLCGTEVRDLLARGVPRRLSKEGVFTYLAYGNVYAPYSLIENVYIVPPGCVVTLDRDKVSVARYWRPQLEMRRWDPNDLQAAITAELLRAVKEQTTDCENRYGPPAAFLSGGIDSSSIVALWRRQYDGEIRTYCVTHEDKRYDEREWARIVAKRNHTKHTELLLDDNCIKMWIDEAIASYDQPSTDGLNFWFATKLLQQVGERCVLSGEGGDELFVGYWQFKKHRLAYKCHPFVKWLPCVLGRALDAIAPNEYVRKLSMLIGYKGDPYYIGRKLLSDWQIADLVRRDILGGVKTLSDIKFEEFAFPEADIINRISCMELMTIVADGWLRDGYQTSKTNNLSLRAPLLDVKVADLIMSASGSLKCDANVSKPLLVKAAGDGLPESCTRRPKKGFSLPFDRYFSGPLKDRVDQFLTGDGCVLFDPKAIKDIGRKYKAGRLYWSRVWLLFMIENWCSENKVTV